VSEARTWRLTGRRIALDAMQAATLAGHGVEDLSVQADEVRLAGTVRLPGCAVTIRCRVLESRDGVLDVSGAPPLNPPDAPHGTPAAPDGQHGRDGEAGRRAGDVHIVCDRIDGSLRVIARGGSGGASQSGGNGVKPATVTGRNGSFTKTPKAFGPWGGRVIQNGDGSAGALGLYWPATRLATVSWGEPGPAGRTGGDGGAPGIPGRGGDGGEIAIACIEAPAVPPQLDSEAGPPGLCGSGGQGGAGGDGGEGGLHCLYYKHGKYEYTVLMNSRIQEAGWAREEWNVPVRANASRAKGAAGKANDTRHETEPGTGGSSACTRIAMAEAAERFGLGYIEQLRAWADRTEAREAIARWGLALLEHLAGGADPGRTTLREALAGMVSRPAERDAE
jgi:hypothetical protein